MTNHWFYDRLYSVMHHSRIRSAIAGSIISATTASAATDYGPMTLFQLLTANEIAVRGIVSNTTDERYELELDSSYRLVENPHSLGVIRFDTYPPETRSGAFADGQSIVLFAVAADDGLVRPLGLAGEGELIRNENDVFVRAMSRPPADLVRTNVPGGTYTAYRLETDIFDQAVTGFYACYQPQAPSEIKRICSDDARDRYRRSSWLAEHLAGIADRVISGGN